MKDNPYKTAWHQLEGQIQRMIDKLPAGDKKVALSSIQVYMAMLEPSSEDHE